MVVFEATALEAALANMGTALTTVVGTITDNTILMTMFAGGLLAVGAKVFKRIKHAAK